MVRQDKARAREPFPAGIVTGSNGRKQLHYRCTVSPSRTGLEPYAYSAGLFLRHGEFMLAATTLLLAALLPAVAAPTARAGSAFLAYPGESIRLNGSASEGADLDFRWVQIGGPRVPLSDADTVRPSFYADLPGRYTFELTVRSGDDASPPDEVDVVVLDAEVGTRYAPGRGCSTLSTASPWQAGWFLLPLAGLTLRRTRERGPS